jgi:hypothetical protein
VEHKYFLKIQNFLLLLSICSASAETIYRVEHFLTEAETTELITAANNLLGKKHLLHEPMFHFFNCSGRKQKNPFSGVQEILLLNILSFLFSMDILPRFSNSKVW